MRRQVQFELTSPVCTFEDRVPLGRRILGKAVSDLEKKSQVTACYLLSLSEQDLQHSDRITVKLTPATTGKLHIFAQRQSAVHQLGDELTLHGKTGQGGEASYSYCASRVGANFLTQAPHDLVCVQTTLRKRIHATALSKRRALRLSNL